MAVVHCEGNDGLQVLHVKLIKRYNEVAKLQGAWNLPRWARRFSSRII